LQTLRRDFETLAHLAVLVPDADTDWVNDLRRLPSRLAWACVCLAVWPFYYAALIVLSVFPTWALTFLKRWSMSDVFALDVRL
jgi:hypothetical protein